MHIDSLSFRAAARKALHAALAWAGRTLPALFETAAKTIREDFSHPLTPREEGIVFCGIVMMFLWGVNKVILSYLEAAFSLQGIFSAIFSPEFAWESTKSVVVLLGLAGGAGAAAGIVATLLWFAGRDIRRRGGLGGKVPVSQSAAVPSTQVQE